MVPPEQLMASSFPIPPEVSAPPVVPPRVVPAILAAPGERHRVMDVLRGIAILGIFIANISAFTMPYLEDRFGSGGEVRAADLQLFDGFVTAFGAGKFRTALAMLFGMGLAILCASALDKGQPWPGKYLKRTLFLALIGCFHGIFLWWGDILFVYALTALVMCFLAQVSREFLIGIFWACAAANFLCGLCLGGFVLLSPGGGGGGEASSFSFWPLGAGDAEAALNSGSLLTIWGYNAALFLFSSVVLGSGSVFLLIGLFALGMVWARDGVLLNPDQFPRARNWTLALGLGVGIPTNLLAIPLSSDPRFLTGAAVWESTFGPMLALGWVMAVAVLVARRGVGQAVILERVGRVALSVYLLQSLLMTTFVYGFKLFGKLPVPALVAIIPAMWAVCILFATLWLRWYRMGPVEWAWRSMIEGKWLPNRRTTSPSESDAAA